MPFFLCSMGRALAQEPTATPTLTFDQQQQSLNMQKLELENDKLKLQVEKLEFQATQTTVPSTSPTTQAETAQKQVEALKLESSGKASELAQGGKDKENLLVVDFVNAEVWNEGVRYSLYQPESMAEDRHWAIEKHVDKIGPDGDHRVLQHLKNLSCLRYEGRARGIVIFTVPEAVDDFSLVTPDGLSFGSGIGDVRKAFPNAYFALDGEKKEGTIRVLKFIHHGDWDFSDKLEFGFDKDGKLVKIRCGILDEH